MSDADTLPGMPPDPTATPAPFLERWAYLSDCGTYRYRLGRRWAPGPLVVWVMLNPSTADADVDDRTIGRCCSFARAWGYGGIDVVNVYGYRATKPADMLAAHDPVGPDNDTVLAAAARRARRDGALLVAAWGAGAQPDRVDHVAALLGDHVTCLGVTANRSPRHPLYVKGDTPLRPWPARG